MVTQVIGVCGSSKGTFTRPSDTTTYTAGDVMSNSTSAGVSITFRNVLKEGCGAIQQALLLDSANQTLLLDAELWLFTTAPASLNDNAAIAITDAEMAFLVGVIDFAVADAKVGLPTSGAGGNAINVQPALGIPIKAVPSATDLYGVLVARNAYVPVSGEIFTVTLSVVY